MSRNSILIIILMFFAFIMPVFAETYGMDDYFLLLDKLKKEQPAVEPDADDLRARYQIPYSVIIESPSGGHEYLVFIFTSEMVSDKSFIIRNKDDFKYLTSTKKMEKVLCVYENEPIKYRNVAVAVSGSNVLLHDGKKLYLFQNAVDCPVFFKDLSVVILVKKEQRQK